MRLRTPPRRRAITQSDVVVLILVVAAFAVVITAISPNFRRRSPPRAVRVVCINNLKQIGLAARIYANDHDDKFPWEVPATNGGTIHLANSPEVFRHFLAMSNELTTPKILFCPADTKRSRVEDFAKLQNAIVSYFVGISSTMSNANALLSGDRNVTGGTLSKGFTRTFTSNSVAGWTKEIHHDAGNVGLADGSAQQVTAAGLNKQLQMVFETTPVVRLAIP